MVGKSWIYHVALGGVIVVTVGSAIDKCRLLGFRAARPYLKKRQF